MVAQALEIVITGRLVGGHPMKRRPVVDKVTKQPVIGLDGQPKTNVSIGVAIPKGAETHWNQTPWGQIMIQAAKAGWPNGEYNSPNFAWKITDGDSAVPNKSGKIPNQKEGYPGHWVLWGTTQFFVECYHPGKYDPLLDQIKTENEIKTGDYCRIGLNVVSNNIKGPVESPGVYLNPTVFELSRAGKEIILTSSANAAEKFGGSQAVIPTNAQLDTSVAAPPVAAPPVAAPPVAAPPVAAPPVAAPPVAAPPVAASPVAAPPVATPPAVIHQMTAKAGGATYDAMIAQGWTDALLLEHGMMLNTSPGVQPSPGILTGQ